MNQIEKNLNTVIDADGTSWYSLDGSTNADQLLPRITNILEIAVPKKLKEYFTNNSKNKQEKVLQVAADFGSRLHEAVENDLKGVPQEVDLDLQDAFFKWQCFREAHAIEASHTEIRAISLNDGFAGTCDIIGTFTSCGDVSCCAKYENGITVPATYSGKAVMDLKTGFYSVKAGWQMAAYRRALIQMGIIDNSYGMVGLSIPKQVGKPVKGFAYEHIEFCEMAFLSCFQTWKALNFSKLNKMKWPYLFKTQLKIEVD